MTTKPYFSYGTNLTASNRDLVTSTIKYENQNKRYFSSIDAEIYMGGERILDINRIDFSYQENKMPVYGFNSFIPSKVFVGQKLIQGTFIINFTKPGYIAELLNRVKESEIANEYDKVGVSCDSNNSALFKKSFDILMGYGGHNTENEDSYGSCYQILQGVYITGFQQILDTSGEPIYEVYTFLARNFSFNGVDNIYKAGATTKTNAATQQETVEEKPALQEQHNETQMTEEQIFDVKLLYGQLTKSVGKIYTNFPKNINTVVDSMKVVISDNVV